ncbi:protein FAM177A1-like [Sinocyclocheilus grahami]|uniref:Protein FAM177A1-like n=1 Tax=Sinocyclocheilus grahami TaxID=75366 RepID=A0A672SQC0_SINGR|nr:PREDICTED: protein FAM177A1-like [Sinocyclocheilus grahami]
MAEVSLYLTNVNVSLGQTMDPEKSSTVVKEFENVELGDLGKKKPRIPRRTIYFASGETMEEYSTDEEEEEEPEKAKTLSTVDTSKLTWGPYVWFHMWRVATSSISVCDYLGEKVASLLGITTPKYQYAIDEYYRMKKEEEEEEEENRLSEEAEHRFEEQHNQEGQQPKIEQPEGTASFVNVTFELEQESHATSDANKVPAPISS